MPEAISKLFETILASTKTHKWWWAGGGATLVAIAVLVVVFGGFFGPSGRDICSIAVQRSIAYGVLPPGAESVGSGKKTEVAKRRACDATAGSDNYVVTADLTCSDLAKDHASLKDMASEKYRADPGRDQGCVSLYAVERSDGLSIYQKRKEETDEGMASMEPPPPQQASPDNAAAPSPDAIPSSTDTAPALPPDSGQSGFGDAPPATNGNNDQPGQQAPQQQ
ncbi:MAG: hypothetical protein WCA81_08590 [Rhizomicrobium sp.]